MIEGVRRWLRRNRTGLTIGFGVIGIGYVAGQYVIAKITEARERMAGDRIAKEKSAVWERLRVKQQLMFNSLRRRFQQNQEDCIITVLELLPTVAENICDALPSEKIAEEIQQKKAQRSGRNTGASEVAPSDFSSGTQSTTVDDDGKSISSFQSESYLHASQMGASSSGNGETRPVKNKTQLWGDLKISCAFPIISLGSFINGIQLSRDLSLYYTLSLF